MFSHLRDYVVIKDARVVLERGEQRVVSLDDLKLQIGARKALFKWEAIHRELPQIEPHSLCAAENRQCATGRIWLLKDKHSLKQGPLPRLTCQL